MLVLFWMTYHSFVPKELGVQPCKGDSSVQFRPGGCRWATSLPLLVNAFSGAEISVQWYEQSRDTGAREADRPSQESLRE
jgi:hypothetical protein